MRPSDVARVMSASRRGLLLERQPASQPIDDNRVWPFAASMTSYPPECGGLIAHPPG